MAEESLRRAPGVSWAVERDGLLVVDSRRGAARALAYPEAAVWDLLSRGENLEATATRLAAIAALPLPDARLLVSGCLSTWRAEGLLEVETADG